MDENLMCPICGGLHPAGHRDKELEEKLESIKKWYEQWGHHINDNARDVLMKILEAPR